MGAGIARIFADGGASVRLTARRQESLDAARERAGEAVATTTDLDEALTGADLVVETIVEEVEPKRACPRARGGARRARRDPDDEHVVALGG